jgi:hypothetical protein
MRGRIKVGRWLPFKADWEGDGRSFVWRARAAWGLVRTIDRYDRNATGSLNVRLLGLIPVTKADDRDTVRSGAGRAAVEAANWTPMSLLPDQGVSWQAVSDEEIVAAWEVPPERPEVHLRIDHDGALRQSWVNRWDNGVHGERGYIPCGGDVLAERRFGSLTIASRLCVGWWFGTPHYEPFFEAEILGAEPIP